MPRRSSSSEQIGGQAPLPAPSSRIASGPLERLPRPAPPARVRRAGEISGAVTKSPCGTELGRARRVVAHARGIEGELHEAAERHEAVLLDCARRCIRARRSLSAVPRSGGPDGAAAAGTGAKCVRVESRHHDRVVQRCTRVAPSRRQDRARYRRRTARRRSYRRRCIVPARMS